MAEHAHVAIVTLEGQGFYAPVEMWIGAIIQTLHPQQIVDIKALMVAQVEASRKKSNLWTPGEPEPVQTG